MRPLKEKISITLDSDIIAKTRKLAEYQQRSFSQYINLVLSRHIAEVEQRGDPREMPPEGLGEA